MSNATDIARAALAELTNTIDVTAETVELIERHIDAPNAGLLVSVLDALDAEGLDDAAMVEALEALC